MPNAVVQTVSRFNILSVLGEGPLGVTVKARDPLMDRIVAIKRRDLNSISANTLAQYRENLSKAAELRHPNLGLIYDTEVANDELLITRQQIEGQPLLESLTLGMKPSTLQRFDFLQKVLSALHTLHRFGFFHGNVKPSNIIRFQGGEQIYLVDMACAGPDLFLKHKIRSIDLAHMSPEQISGKHDIDFRSDVFSAATLIYETLALKSPFQGTSHEEIAASVCRAEHLPAERSVPGLPGLDALLRKALQPDPTKRCSLEDLISGLAKLRDVARQADPNATFVSRLPSTQMFAPAEAPVRVEEQLTDAESPYFLVAKEDASARTDIAAGTPPERLIPVVLPKEDVKPYDSRPLPLSVWRLAAAVALLVLALGYFVVSVVTLPLSFTWAKSTGRVANTQNAAPQETVLEINATPWATVKKISSLDGRTVVSIKEPTTPMQVKVDEGTYRITAVGPDGKTERNAVVDITEGQSSFVSFEFKRVDARAIVDAY